MEIDLTEIKTSKEYFQKVCNEIGKKYESKGFKYLSSRPKIIYKDTEIKLEITFWSSRTNELGNYINLEILPNFHSIELRKNKKGYLFGHTSIFTKKYLKDKSKIRVNQIYGETLERTDEYSRESVIYDNNNCNVNDFNEYKLNKIIEFIDSKIIIWIEKIKTEEGIFELTENIPDSVTYNLRESINFIEYCKINFPKIDILERLKN
ncbi:hypothetical protein R3X25_11705 [Lutibacter sp. TH_r2]|uniref:hypothetical protein n=1 Tax=Lutibacter sp. TH_r2 TaxID=3082083 RepID=UPI002954262F|nr:hypothetical protein [Lutibacter sp. TH_r2]MDV7187948.1 hypothetical protein [Lutibacter sp. TH_r2]